MGEKTLQGVRVLYAVADPGTRPHLDALREAGAVVSWPRSRSQAFRWLAEVRPHVVVTDDASGWTSSLILIHGKTPEDLVSEVFSRTRPPNVVQGET